MKTINKSDKHNWYKSIDGDIKTELTKYFTCIFSFRKRNSYTIHLDVDITNIDKPDEILEDFEKKHFQSVYNTSSPVG